MDTITHGLLGAVVVQATMKKKLPPHAAWIGAVGAMLPDADVFIYSFSDPTVSWLYHRHFTHSFVFVPIGGLITALIFLLLKRFRGHASWVVLAGMVGYALHAPLDALTTYGTQLFWPFSNNRVALDTIGIVDPIYSVVLLIGMYLTARRRAEANAMWPARVALTLSCLYLCFGAWQHHRGVQAQSQLASMRGQQIEHARVLPAPGWLVMWRSAYTVKGPDRQKLYVDGMRLNWWGEPRVLPGGSADVTTFSDLPARAQANAETRRRFGLFTWFADGLVALIQGEPDAYGDERITFEVETLTPLWGLKIDEATGEAMRWNPPAGQRRNIGQALRALALGDPRYRTLAELRR